MFHGGEYASYEFFRHISMKQVGHGIDEDSPGFYPLQRELETGFPEAQIKALLVMMSGNPTPPFSERQRIAVVTARRHLSTPCDRIPCGICPLNGGAHGHLNPLQNICTTVPV